MMAHEHQRQLTCCHRCVVGRAGGRRNQSGPRPRCGASPPRPFGIMVTQNGSTARAEGGVSRGCSGDRTRPSWPSAPGSSPDLLVKDLALGR